MKYTIKISVDAFHPFHAGKFINILRNQFEVDESFKYDYHSLINGIKLLYPNKQLIINISIF